MRSGDYMINGISLFVVFKRNWVYLALNLAFNDLGLTWWKTSFMELDELKAEVSRLANALEEASSDKIKAAQYGLQVLDEKQQLEVKLTQLQTQFDTAKAEAEATKKALAQFQSQQKSVAKSDIDHEESLLEETMNREQEYLAKIAALEADLKNCQHELDRYRTDLDRLQTLHINASEAASDLDMQKRQLKEDLKELKNREQRLLNDYSELEEENISLQKQLSNLRSAQIEFESMKMEVKRLMDENDQLQADKDEANKLTIVAQKHLEDALLNVQQERDQKLAYKKELELMRNAEHLQQLNTMLFGLQNDDEDDSQALKEVHYLFRILLIEIYYYSSLCSGGAQKSCNRHIYILQLESSFIADANEFGKNRPPKGADLFSEIHGDMPERLAELETKNDQLSLKLKETEKDVNYVIPVLKRLEVMSTPDLDHAQLKQLCDDALKKIEQLIESASKAVTGGKQYDLIKADLHTAIMVAGENQAKLASAQDLMIAVADFLYRLYHQLVSTHGLEADKSAAEIMKKLKQYANENAENEGVESGTETEGGRSPRLMLNLQRQFISPSFAKFLNQELVCDRLDDILTESDFRERIVPGESNVFRVSDCLTELSKIVRRTVENALNTRVENQDHQELTLQNMKLRSLLATKRDQIATLRTVLKSNKLTAESALASLKEKYESEKAMTHELLERLRRELKAFKEDAATFASHRAMFTARCEELQAQVDEMAANQKAAEDEKRTLNSLLRMAIQQKLALTQRLEDLEVDRERQAFKRGNKTSGRVVNSDGSGQLHRVRYPGQNIQQQQRNLKRDY
uniref:Protein bicaudal D n=1 Tax=Wuchereria bancrofti TaxID=6293 RepID=A0A1I8EE59_WUCBA